MDLRTTTIHRTNQSILSKLSMVAWIICLVPVMTATPALQSQEPLTDSQVPQNAPSLPLPAHPGRVTPPEENTLPKAAQPKREKHHTSVAQKQKANRLPVPGKPGRSLEPLGEPEDEMEDEEEEDEEEPDEEEPPPGLFYRLPHEWRDGGLIANYVYTGETFTKAHGGIHNRKVSNYRSNFDLTVAGDTEKLGWWDSGRFFVYGQNVAGRPLSINDVGDAQLFSNIDSTISPTTRPEYTTVSEYWYEHYLLDKLVRIKMGKQDSNVDFALSDVGGEFVHSAFVMPPMIPMPTFPSQALGVATFFQLRENLIAAVGVYDGTLSSGPTGARWGFDTVGDNGAMSLYQLEWKPQSGPNGQHPGTYRIGAWHHSDRSVWTEFTTNPVPRVFCQNYGYWLSADQMIWKESYGDDDDQGLSIFGLVSWAPGDRNMLQEVYTAGVVYKGLMPRRDSDFAGVGFSNALISSRYREAMGAGGTIVGSNETAVELFYKFVFSPYFSLQPDLQYISHPGGQFKDALLPGVRFEMVL